MKDYTIAKQFPLSQDQNEAVDFMLNRPFCINACQTGLGKTYLSLTALMHILVANKDLFERIEPLGLAIWFMDDGSKEGNSGYLLCTNSFSNEVVTTSYAESVQIKSCTSSLYTIFGIFFIS